VADSPSPADPLSSPAGKLSLATTATDLPPVARGPMLGAAIGGGLATVGAALAAIPFPLPWLGPLLSAVLVGVGTIIAALNGADLSRLKR